MKVRPIRIWRFKDIPKKYRRIITDWDDIEWVAFVPKEVLEREGYYIAFMEVGTPFGWCEVKTYELKDGELWVGYHA